MLHSRTWIGGQIVLAFVIAGHVACHKHIETKPHDSSPGSERVAARDSEPDDASTQIADATKPDILWIVLDACRAANLSCYGYERTTSPNMDALAREGVLFERHFAQSNWTPRSVSSYMTGLYFPVPCMDMGPFAFAEFKPTESPRLLPRILKEDGFTTTLISTHTGFLRPGFKLARDFDEVHFLHQGSLPGSFEDINGILLPLLSKPGNSPKFIYVHVMDTHLPREAHPGYEKWLDEEYRPDCLSMVLSGHLERKDGEPFSEADKAFIRGTYDASIAFADNHIGEVIEQLRAGGALDSTVVIIGADHGECLGEDDVTTGHMEGGTVDELFHVPLIMAGWGTPNGVRVGALTENVDIVPTLMDMLHLTTNTVSDGQSLLSTFSSQVVHRPRKHAFAWIHGHGNAGRPLLTLWNGSFKYDHDLMSAKDQLWRMPDGLGHRTDVTVQESAVQKQMETVLFRDYVPRWEEFLRLPIRRVSFNASRLALFVEPQEAVLRDVVVDDEPARCDGKWGLSSDGVLWCCGTQEDAPELRFSYPIRNGKYVLRAFPPTDGPDTTDSLSSLCVKVEDNPEFLSLAVNGGDRLEGTEALSFIEFEVTDGELTLVLAPSPDAEITALRSVVVSSGSAGLRPGAPSSEEGRQGVSFTGEQEDALRALGYL